MPHNWKVKSGKKLDFEKKKNRIGCEGDGYVNWTLKFSLQTADSWPKAATVELFESFYANFSKI